MGDDKEPEAWIRSFMPWNSRHRKYSGILTQDQRKALLAPGKLEGESGREMRKRIRRRVRHALYDFVLLNRYMRNKDRLRVFAREDRTNAFSTPHPDDMAVKSFLEDLDKSMPATATSSLYASDSMERFLYGIVETLDDGMNPEGANTSWQKNHPLIDAGIAESYPEAHKLERFAHQAAIISELIESPEDELGIEYLNFVTSMPPKGAKTLKYYDLYHILPRGFEERKIDT